MAVAARHDLRAQRKIALISLSEHGDALAAGTEVTEAEQVHSHIVSADDEPEKEIGYGASSGSGGFGDRLGLLGQQLSRKVAHSAVSFPSLFAALYYA